MSIKVELTGQNDREGPWKALVAGFGGSGKTMLASTATEPLFVFFKENPPLKSVASRQVPHVKLTNELDDDGRLVVAAHDKLLALLTFLQIQDHNYSTLVLDTGDELFQAMKESRRVKNNGEFGPGDWDWLAIHFKAVMEAVIEMPMDVMALFHIKNEVLSEGETYRDLLLQGSVTPQVSTWFDVVGVMDSYEVVNDEGETITRRSFLTSPSRLYPWLKDHSGSLPRRYDLSSDFTGDYKKMRAMWTEGPDVPLATTVQEIPDIDTTTPVEEKDVIPVPSPEDLEKQKIAPPAKVDEPEVEAQAGDMPDASASTPSEDVAPIPSEPEPEAKASDNGQQEEKPVTEEEAVSNVTEALDAQAVKVCSECGNEIDDGMYDISQIRFRRALCRDHYRAELEAANA